MTRTSKKAAPSNVILKEDGKFNWLYIKNVVMYHARVAEPVDKYKGKDGEQEYNVTVFVDEASKDKLEELDVNKNFFEVDVDTITKGKRKGEVKYSSETYEGCEGMFGFTISLPSKTKAGKDAFVTVVDAQGKKLDALIGNGSKGNVKCMVWTNEDEQLNLRLNLLHVLDLVPYEAGGPVEDDTLGITYEVGGNKKKDSELDPELEGDEPDFDDDDDDSDY